MSGLPLSHINLAGQIYDILDEHEHIDKDRFTATLNEMSGVLHSSEKFTTNASLLKYIKAKDYKTSLHQHYLYINKSPSDLPTSTTTSPSLILTNTDLSAPFIYNPRARYFVDIDCYYYSSPMSFTRIYLDSVSCDTLKSMQYPAFNENCYTISNTTDAGMILTGYVLGAVNSSGLHTNNVSATVSITPAVSATSVYPDTTITINTSLSSGIIIDFGYVVEESDYDDYFCITALENDCQVTFNFPANYYSLSISNNGLLWQEFVSTAESFVGMQLQNGESIFFRGKPLKAFDENNHINISSTKQISASGNVFSLLYCDPVNFNNPNIEIPTYFFYKMFENCITLVTAPDIPHCKCATGAHHFDSMFLGCTSLLVAPDLHIHACFGNDIFQHMFSGCTSLTVVPILDIIGNIQDLKGAQYIEKSAGTYASRALFAYMFSNCTGLKVYTKKPSENDKKYAPFKLPYHYSNADGSVTDCTSAMFANIGNEDSPTTPALNTVYYCEVNY